VGHVEQTPRARRIGKTEEIVYSYSNQRYQILYIFSTPQE
jgi:hypothetical protein